MKKEIALLKYNFNLKNHINMLITDLPPISFEEIVISHLEGFLSGLDMIDDKNNRIELEFTKHVNYKLNQELNASVPWKRILQNQICKDNIIFKTIDLIDDFLYTHYNLNSPKTIQELNDILGSTASPLSQE